MASNQWFVQQNGIKRGPFTPAQLSAAASKGELQREDLVWREGLQNWVPARKLKGLFQPQTDSNLSSRSADVPRRQKHRWLLGTTSVCVMTALLALAVVKYRDNIPHAFRAVRHSNEAGRNAVHDAADHFTAYRNSYAVIVGIDTYQTVDMSLPNLRFAVNDAEALRSILVEEFGYQDQHILYLTNEQATRNKLQTAFTSWLAGKALRETDSLLLFYAGHGLVDERSGDGYLATCDSHPADLDSCLGIRWVRDAMASTPCLHKVMILDSCYSGALFSKLRLDDKKVDAPGAVNVPGSSGTLPMEWPSDKLSSYLSKPAFLGLSAGRDTPVSDGFGTDHHSAFTTALLEVLQRRADSTRNDQAFTFRQVAARVEMQVASDARTPQLPDFGYLSPGSGDFIFLPRIARECAFSFSGSDQLKVGIRNKNGRYMKIPHTSEPLRLTQGWLYNLWISDREVGDDFVALPKLYVATPTTIEHFGLEIPISITSAELREVKAGKSIAQAYYVWDRALAQPSLAAEAELVGRTVAASDRQSEGSPSVVTAELTRQSAAEIVKRANDAIDQDPLLAKFWLDLMLMRILDLPSSEESTRTELAELVRATMEAALNHYSAQLINANKADAPSERRGRVSIPFIQERLTRNQKTFEKVAQLLGRANTLLQEQRPLDTVIILDDLYEIADPLAADHETSRYALSIATDPIAIGTIAALREHAEALLPSEPQQARRFLVDALRVLKSKRCLSEETRRLTLSSIAPQIAQVDKLLDPSQIQSLSSTSMLHNLDPVVESMLRGEVLAIVTIDPVARHESSIDAFDKANSIARAPMRLLTESQRRQLKEKRFQSIIDKLFNRAMLLGTTDDALAFDEETGEMIRRPEVVQQIISAFMQIHAAPDLNDQFRQASLWHLLDQLRLLSYDNGPIPPKSLVKTLEALKMPVELDFVEQRFDEVLAYLKELYAIDIAVNWNDLSAIAVEPDTPFTGSGDKLPLSEALSKLLDDVGNGELYYFPTSTGVGIASRGHEHITYMSYPILEILAARRNFSADQLIRQIKESIAPESWRPEASGEIRYIPEHGVLHVAQRWYIHSEIADVLSSLRMPNR